MKAAPLLIPSILISLLLGIGIGYSFSPAYRQEMDERQSGMKELGENTKLVDKYYLENVIAHHMTAIDMAEQALENSQREEVKNLANTIITVDSAAIEKLYTQRQDWYSDSSKITRFPKINLGSYDENFDLRLLNGLIVHHQEAIAMAKEVQSKSTRNEVLTLAGEIGTSLTDGVVTLKQWRQDWYNLEAK